MATPAAKTAAEPRISVNDLALYMVSSDTARLSIIKRSKYPQKPPMIRYARIREPIRVYLSDPIRNVNPLVAAEQMLVQLSSDSSQKPLVREDAKLSIEVLHALQGMANKLGPLDFHLAPARQGKLLISGVTVSAHADLLVHGTSKGEDQFGAAILRMTQDDAETEAAKSKRKEMGQYVAAIASLHAEQNLESDRAPANRLSMSIDVQHGEIFPATNSNTRRISNIQSACTMIAALWPML